MLYCCGHGISSLPCISILAFVPSFSSFFFRFLEPHHLWNSLKQISAHCLSYGFFFPQTWSITVDSLNFCCHFEIFRQEMVNRWADPRLRRATMLCAGWWIRGHHSRVGEVSWENTVIPNVLGKKPYFSKQNDQFKLRWFWESWYWWGEIYYFEM